MKKKLVFFNLFLILTSILSSCMNPSNPSLTEPYYEGINYLKNSTNAIYSQSCPTTNAYGLKITEVSFYWIEIFNTNQVGGDAVCLSDYKLRSSRKSGSVLDFDKYILPRVVIPPRSYLVIRFYGDEQNNSRNILIMNELGMYSANNYHVGLFELVKINVVSLEETVDFVTMCTDGNGNRLGNPLTGVFTGCLSFPDSEYKYGSFALDANRSDNNNATDWTFRNIVTFGGKNDVTDVTDNDRDGIPDENEQPGKTFAGMQLYDWGARPNKKDIFVHIAYMDGSDYRYNNILIKEGLTPFKESFENIRTVFSNNGYNLHFDLGKKYSTTTNPQDFNLSGNDHEVPYSDYVDIGGSAMNSTETPDAVSIILYKNLYMPINRMGIFHFGLIANLYSARGTKVSAGGVAELPGNDFLVLTGNSGIQNYLPVAKHNHLATIVMHELGHNLNLGHGGSDHENNKPNYFSIMNYAYAYAGVPRSNDARAENFFNRYLLATERYTNRNFRVYDSFYTNTFNLNFSHGTVPALDEANLSEINPLGLGIGNVDWNVDGSLTSQLVDFDLNSKGDGNRGLSILSDYNDWANLQIPFDQRILGNGYGNLRLAPDLPDDDAHTHALVNNRVDSASIPRGAALVGEEGTSPYIVDKIPPIFQYIKP